MSEAVAPERRAKLQSGLLDRLHDPTQLRVCLTAVVLAVAYAALYLPLNDHVSATTKKLDATKQRLDLAHDVEQLREKFGGIASRLPQQTDTKEWVRYMLAGIHKFPLTLNALKCNAPRDLGPYKVVVLQIDVSGTFSDLDKFLCWLDTNQRLFRTDNVRFSPPSRDGGPVLSMRLTVLGVMG
jgi:hypothetical protein